MARSLLMDGEGWGPIQRFEGVPAMRTVHLVYSSTFVVSLVTACSAGPGDEGRSTHENLSTSRHPTHVMPTAGRSGVVGGACTAGSTLSNPGNGPVMHGTVNIYLLWYGFVSDSVKSAVQAYVTNLSESSYLAMN